MKINNIQFDIKIRNGDELYNYTCTSIFDITKGISYAYRNINYDLMKNLDPVFLSVNTPNFPDKDKIIDTLNIISFDLFREINNIDMKHILSGLGLSTTEKEISLGGFNNCKDPDKPISIKIIAKLL